MFKILITGSTGFVGKNLVEKLSLKKFLIYEAFYDKEKNFINLVRKFNNKEIESQIKFENMEKIDCVVNCAAMLPGTLDKKKNNLHEYRKNNVEQTLNTAKQMFNKGVKRFIHLSTILVDDLKETKNDNSLLLNFLTKKKKFQDSRDYYRISKLECEIALMEFSKKTGLEVVILRPPLIYGKFVKGNFLSLLNLVHKKIPLPFKNIKNIRSYCGVDNLTDLITVCLNHPKAAGKIFSVSDGEDITISDLIEKISKYMQRPIILYSFPLSFLKFICKLIFKTRAINNLTDNLRVDILNTCKTLDWIPASSLDDGIKKTVDWYLKNK
jgi:nucleoside-diphosphate-sugar epimerase